MMESTTQWIDQDVHFCLLCYLEIWEGPSKPLPLLTKNERRDSLIAFERLLSI